MDQIHTLNQNSWKERLGEAWRCSLAAFEAILTAAAVNHYNVFATNTTESENTTIQTAISSGLNAAWDVLKAIGVPVAILAVAFCAFQFFLNGDKGMEVAQKRLLYIVLGIALLLLAPFLISTVVGWFNGHSTWWDYESSSTASTATA